MVCLKVCNLFYFFLKLYKSFKYGKIDKLDVFKMYKGKRVLYLYKN